MKIKICGITRLEDAICAIKSGAWAIGFIFYDKSPRYISPEKAGEIIRQLPDGIKKVGVFVNSSVEKIMEVKKISGIDIIQLHGDETPEMCEKLSGEIIKAIRPSKEEDILVLKDYTNASYFLIDAKVKGEYGGTGKVSDWTLAVKAKKYGKIILAGGINSENINHAIKEVNPFAFDLSSSVETEPGIKDHEKIKKVFNSL